MIPEGHLGGTTEPDQSRPASSPGGGLRARIGRSGLRQSHPDLSIILVARVCMSASRALAGIVVTIYLTLRGFSGLSLGLLFLAVGVTSLVMSSFVGLVSERWGPKPFMVAVPLVAAAAGVTFAATSDVWALVLAACLGTYGRGAGAGANAVGPYQPAEAALLTQRALPQHRNRAFGWLATSSSLGALAGGLIAAVSAPATRVPAAALDAFRLTFLITAALAAGAGLLALRLSTDAPGSGADRPRVRWPRHSQPLLLRLWATNLLTGVGNGLVGPFVTYWFYRRYGTSAAELGALFAVVNVCSLGSTLSASGIARRYGIVRSIVAVRVGQALLLIPLALAPTFWVAAGVYLLRMLVARIGLPLRQSYVLGMADPSERASVMALSNVPAQAAMAASPVFAGYLFDEISLALPFELSSLILLANAGLYWLFFRRRPPEEEEGAGAARRTRVTG